MQKISKAIITFFVLSILVFFSSEQVIAQTNRVSITPKTQSLNVGEEATVAINITDTSNLYGFQFDLTFNPSVLQYVSLTKGTFIGDADSTYWVPLDASTAGTVKNIAVTRTVSGTVSGSGTLVSVRFRALAGGSSTIGIQNLDLSDAQANKISSTSEGGEVVVRGVVPTVDLKANNSDGPVSIAYNASATLSWTSSNATSCTASSTPAGLWTGSKSTPTGSESTGNLTSSRTYTLTCAGTGGTANDSVTINVGAQPTLSVSLSVDPFSDVAPLTDAVLKADVSGTAVGPVNYTFYCNRPDSLTSITPNYNHKQDNVTSTSYSTPAATCDSTYANPGNYTAKVIVERGGVQVESRVQLVLRPPVANLRLTPFLEADSNPNDNDVTVVLCEAGTSNVKAEGMYRPSSGIITIPTIRVSEGNYDIVISCPYHLTKRLSSVSIASNANIQLPILPAGDLNRDNIINSLDWSLMSSKWFASDPIGDLNKDGIVNSLDWSFMNGNWQLKGD